MEKMVLDPSMTIGQLQQVPQLARFKEMIFTWITPDVQANTIASYGNEKGELIPALEYLAEKNTQEEILFPVYSQEECAANPELTQVQLLYFRAEKPVSRGTVIVCPGGGYNREWALVEGYPIARRMNQLGYHSFVLFYRTHQKGLLPKPMDDLAAAVKYIRKHEQDFDVDGDQYAVCGFSSGGHLAAEWGTANHGCRAYGLPKPKGLMLGYPAWDNLEMCQRIRQIAGMPAYKAVYEAGKVYLERVCGEDLSLAKAEEFSVTLHMDREYPDTYVVHCIDDPTVAVKGTYAAKEKFDELGIRSCFRFAEKGGHSFGLGNGTDAQGWPEEAVQMIFGQKKEG
jgi:acetyl esterase/lipase